MGPFVTVVTFRLLGSFDRAHMKKRIRTAIQAEFEAGDVQGKGKIRNVDEGGVFVGTSQIPHQGEMVVLSFRDMKGREVDITGLVWWTTTDEPGSHRAPGFGIRLLEESEAYSRFFQSLR